MTSSVKRFLDHTQRRTTVGRTPLDEESVRRLMFILHTTYSAHLIPIPVTVVRGTPVKYMSVVRWTDPNICKTVPQQMKVKIVLAQGMHGIEQQNYGINPFILKFDTGGCEW